MADAARKLLDHIVRRYVVPDELVAIDLDATAIDRGKALESDKQEAVRRESQRASELAGAFARGLALAYERRGAGLNELTLDDRRPDENAIADALIGFLVSYGLAASRTEETEPMHYVYHISVDWDRLAAVARAAGVDLAEAVRHHG